MFVVQGFYPHCLSQLSISEQGNDSTNVAYITNQPNKQKGTSRRPFVHIEKYEFHDRRYSLQ